MRSPQRRREPTRTTLARGAPRGRSARAAPVPCAEAGGLGRAKEEAYLRALEAEGRRIERLEAALQALGALAGGWWEQARRAEWELLVLRAARDETLASKALGRRVAAGKAPAHMRRLVLVAVRFGEVEERSRTTKKAVVVRELLGVSLPTYRACVAELRERARDDQHLQALLERSGWPPDRETFSVTRGGPPARRAGFRHES